MQIRKVVVGSESAIKSRAVKAALKAIGFNDIEPVRCKVESGVSVQPFGKREMGVGARRRAVEAYKIHPDADLYIGIENGLVKEEGQWFDPCCVAVFFGGRNDYTLAFSAHFPVPKWIVDRVKERQSEMGVVIQELADGGEKDPMKWFSCDTVNREALIAQAVQCALLEIVFPERYREPVRA